MMQFFKLYTWSGGENDKTHLNETNASFMLVNGVTNKGD